MVRVKSCRKRVQQVFLIMVGLKMAMVQNKDHQQHYE